MTVILEKPFETLILEHNPQAKVLFFKMKATPRPCFTPQLLADISTFQDDLHISATRDLFQGKEQSVDYLVLSSATPGVFNLGGDLDVFVHYIRTKDHEALTQYAYACIKVLYKNLKNLYLPISTIALIEGDALGGGFEAALSCDSIVAEKGTMMGFPEVLFNLFPGMGGYSFLSRRLSALKAQQMVLSGEIYTAEKMFEMGVVDVLAEKGEGKAALYDFIRKSEKRSVARGAVRQIRDQVNPITYEELCDITDLWVESALKLSDKNLRMMERLIKAQDKK